MAIEKLHIEKFLELAKQHPVVDVRSPGEYAHAHIPGAYSLPLFTDEERKLVGTAYKQQSREQAIKIGLDFFGGKMRKMVEEVEVCQSQESKSARPLNSKLSTQKLFLYIAGEAACGVLVLRGYWICMASKSIHLLVVIKNSATMYWTLSVCRSI
ncbi:MAG: hypothetical protein IPN56_14960 [Chitinophagaceae bacterium]|nr:hypothetical protein [Chitinophagaceae bacterium]